MAAAVIVPGWASSARAVICFSIGHAASARAHARVRALAGEGIDGTAVLSRCFGLVRIRHETLERERARRPHAILGGALHSGVARVQRVITPTDAAASAARGCSPRRWQLLDGRGVGLFERL